MWKIDPKQLPRSLTNSLIAIKKELSQPGYSQEACDQVPYRKPKSLLSAKYAEAGSCDLTTKHIHNTCLGKLGWFSKVGNNQQKEKPFESLISYQGEKPRRAPQESIKYQSNIGMSLGIMFQNFPRLYNLSICHFNFDQYKYIKSHKAKH